jgi:hypothetical protein
MENFTREVRYKIACQTTLRLHPETSRGLDPGKELQSRLVLIFISYSGLNTVLDRQKSVLHLY